MIGVRGQYCGSLSRFEKPNRAERKLSLIMGFREICFFLSNFDLSHSCLAQGWLKIASQFTLTYVGHIWCLWVISNLEKIRNGSQTDTKITVSGSLLFLKRLFFFSMYSCTVAWLVRIRWKMIRDSRKKRGRADEQEKSRNWARSEPEVSQKWASWLTSGSFE